MTTILLLLLASTLASWLMLRRRARRGGAAPQAEPLLVNDAPAPEQMARFQGTGTFVWAFDKTAEPPRAG